jgi:hypothetical protein
MATSVKGQELIAGMHNSQIGIGVLVSGATKKNVGVFSDPSNRGKTRNGKRASLTKCMAGKDMQGPARKENLILGYITTLAKPTEAFDATAKLAYAAGEPGKPSNLERCPLTGETVIVRVNRAKVADGSYAKIGKGEVNLGRAILEAYDKDAKTKIEKLAGKFIVCGSTGRSDANVQAQAKAEAKKQAKLDAMSEAERAVEAFKAKHGSEPKCRWEWRGKACPKATLDFIEHAQSCVSKTEAKKMVVNLSDVAKAKAYRDQILPLLEAANKSQPATASTAEKSQSDIKRDIKRANKVAGVKATPSLRQEAAKAS